MKKLLKSILIATASLGAIAGSTAAVVSCGQTSTSHDQNDNPTSLQGDYDAALTTIQNYFKTNAIFTASEHQMIISDNTNNIIKGLIQESVAKYINSTDINKLPNIQRESLKSEITPADISVQIEGNLDRTLGDHETEISTNNIIIIVPANETLVSEPITLFEVKYTVIEATEQENIYKTQVEIAASNAVASLAQGVTGFTFLLNISSSFIYPIVSNPAQYPFLDVQAIRSAKKDNINSIVSNVVVGTQPGNFDVSTRTTGTETREATFTIIFPIKQTELTTGLVAFPINVTIKYTVR